MRGSDTFVGRAADLTRLSDLLAEGHRVITVTGPPGVGKTRLVRHLLATMGPAAGELGAGAPPAWCRLAETRTLDEMAAAIAHAMRWDLSAAPIGDPIERIGAALAERGGLVVLDEIERLLDVAGGALAAWLERAPGVQFIVTSRARVGIDDEIVHALGPLSLPDEGGNSAATSEAIALFVHRAQRVVPDFDAGQGDPPLLARLVRALDGLPLAIELAAARVGVLGPADLLRRLERRFEVLRRARAAPGDPHGALRAAIDGSWELLRAPERAVFSQCAVFRGGFDLDAAESVLVVPAADDPDPPNVLDVLDVLQRHSLVVTRSPMDEPQERRFVVLESLRDYALAELERSGERAPAAARHARYYAERATREAAARDETPGVDELRWLARERDNVAQAAATFLDPSSAAGDGRGALRALLTLEPWADSYGYWEGYGALLESALRRVRDAGSDDATELLELRARLAWLRWRRSVAPLTEITEACHEVLARARARNDGRLVAGALLELGGSAQYARPEEARAAYEGAIAEQVARGDRRGEARARIALGTVCHRLGLAARAVDEATRAADLLEALGDARGHARALTLLSLALGELGEFERLCAVAARALPVLSAHYDRRWEAFCVLGLGLAAQARGDWTDARAHFDRAFHLARQVGDARLASCREVCLGRLDHERGDLVAAIDAYLAGLPALATVGDRTTQGLFEAYLGAAFASRDDTVGAHAAFGRADALLGDQRVPALEKVADLLRGHLDLALSRAADPARAASHRLAARERLRAFDPHARARTDAPSAEDLFVAARMLSRALGEPEPQPESQPEPTPAPTPSGARRLRIGPEGRWFQVEGGVPCTFRRPGAMRDLLLGLIALRERAPGRAARLPELFSMGWPAERALPSSASNRVYVALSRLRAMGLGPLLVSRNDGWLLDPAIVVERVDAEVDDTFVEIPSSHE